MDVFDLFAKLSLDSSSYDKGIEGAEKSASNFSANLKKGLAVAGSIATASISAMTAGAVVASKKFIDSAKSTATFGDSVDKNSQKVGFSAQKWQEWSYVLNLAGSSMESATMGIKTMTNQVDKAKKGNKEAVAEFKALGISVKDLKKMSREEIFEKVISQLQKMPESANRASIANKLLGRSGQELSALFNMTNEETQKAIKTANEYGMVLSDKGVKASANFQDSLTTLQNTMSGLKNTMMANFLPSLTTVMDGLSQVFSGKNSDEGMKKIEVGIMGLIDKLKAEMPKWIELGKTIFSSVIKGFAPMLPSLISTIFDIGVQAISTISSMLPSMMPIIITGIQNSLTALLSALPIIFDGLSQLVLGIVNWLADSSNVELVVRSIVSVCTQIVNSIGMILPILLPAIATIIGKVAEAMTEESNISMLIDALLTIIGGLAVGIVKSLPVLAKAITNVVKNLGELLSKFFEKAVPLVANGIGFIVDKAKALGNNIKTSVSNFFSEALMNLGKFISDLISKVADLPKKMKSIGTDAIKGLWQGISDMSKWIGEKIKGFGSGVLKGLKDFFKIKSPSRLLSDEVGKFLAMGIGEGFEDKIPDVIGDMTDSMSGITADLNASVKPASAMSSNTGAFNAGGFTVNVYGAEGQDIRELAKAVSQEIQNLINDKERVYA